MGGFLVTKVLILFAALVSVRATAADDPGVRDARALYEQGTKHYQLGEYAPALESFKKGYWTRRNPAFLYNIGQCYRMLGDAENAAMEYRAFLRESPNATNRADVEQFIRDADEAVKKKEAQKERPPTGVLLTKEEVAKVEPPPPPPAKPRRWWIPVAIGGAAVVVDGAAIGLAFGLPDNVPAHGGTDSGATIHF